LSILEEIPTAKEAQPSGTSTTIHKITNFQQAELSENSLIFLYWCTSIRLKVKLNQQVRFDYLLKNYTGSAPCADTMAHDTWRQGRVRLTLSLERHCVAGAIFRPGLKRTPGSICPVLSKKATMRHGPGIGVGLFGMVWNLIEVRVQFSP
jgi:hypothetical protein